MKNKMLSLVLLSVCTLLHFQLNSQTNTDPVLMTVAGEKVTKSEFIAVFQKNSQKDAAIDRKSLDEYVDLYINFRLKVKEAEELGADTSKTFLDEFNGYRKQLAQPYLVDKSVNEKLLQEAYERMKSDVKASHILLKIDQNALPKDTLVVYNNIMELRKRIIKGDKFDQIARENSEDPSAKENGGDL